MRVEMADFSSVNITRPPSCFSNELQSYANALLRSDSSLYAIMFSQSLVNADFNFTSKTSPDFMCKRPSGIKS